MHTQILTDFTQDRSEVKGALDQLRIPGFSEINLYDALAFTIDRMKDIQGRKAIFVICTGVDTFSKLNYGEMLKISKASDTVIYPISILEFMDVRGNFGMTAIEAKNQLNFIAQYSGGQAYFPRFDTELPRSTSKSRANFASNMGLVLFPPIPPRTENTTSLKWSSWTTRVTRFGFPIGRESLSSTRCFRAKGTTRLSPRVDLVLRLHNSG